MSRRLTLSEFIEKALFVHGDTYDYASVVYTNSRTKINITCKTHGGFQQRPHNHLQGQGCTKCGDENMALRQTRNTELFNVDLLEHHGVVSIRDL